MTLQPPRTVDLLMGGRRQPPRAGAYEPATSPVTGGLTGHAAQGDRADAGATVQAAVGALTRWRPPRPSSGRAPPRRYR
ncbi:MAG TPA: hypothetical protein VHZ03_17665 [Trebonia sp.]|jgi:acyl-CoA reductase-like NAD-dependent aldehyde dehydrogenase|nr:hypothetical protein [Trebonia sp.]